MMNNHNQDSNQLSRKHERLARAAPWFAGLSLLGAATVEAASAQPASAGTEITTTYEAVAPQAFMNSFDKKLVREEQMMHSSPYFSSIKPHQINKAFSPDLTIEYVGAPSKQYPGRYDWLAVTMVKGISVPINASINMGTRSKTYTGINGIYETGYVFGQSVSGSGKPNAMMLEADHTPVTASTMHNFAISSGGYSADLIPSTSVRYSDDPAAVSAKFNSFLNQVHSITTHK